ncbi:MAG: DUF5011 domain-containing protein [Acidobacteria bacterium]|nr:DUF5011 domain-containing protein [Acidobacteriota bacterium]
MLNSLAGSSALRPAAQIAATESIDTFASDCSTSQNSFQLGNTVCAVATGAPAPFFGVKQRRFQWVAPNGAVARLTDITTDPAQDSYTIPTTGPFAQPGTWAVRTIKNNGSVASLTRFVVRDPAHARVDLNVFKNGPLDVKANGAAVYQVTVENRGPDDAQNVVLTDNVPANTTFVSDTQNSGDSFNCTDPSVGGVGAITCTLGTLHVGDSATFTFIFQVDGSAPVGSSIDNTATVSSDTIDISTGNNSSSTHAGVNGTIGGNQCVIDCPADVIVAHDTGVATAVVNYPDPTTSGSNCGAVSCSSASGSAFPVGVTTVVCTTEVPGTECSFAVTVEDTVAPTISCPADIHTNEDSEGAGIATVTYATPSGADDSNSVSVTCDRPSGSAFPVGTTTVTCTATDAGGNEAACSFDVVVDGTGACELHCPANVVVDINSGCGTIVNYPAPTATSCGTVHTSKASGTFFPVGVTTVSVTTTAGQACEFTVTVREHTNPTFTAPGPASAVADADCQAVVPDFTANLNPQDNCTESDFLIVSQNPAAGTVVSGAGPHTVTVSVTDASGNTASANTTFTVIDATAPTITLNGTSPMTVECHTSFTDPGATAHDSCAGDFAATATGTVNVNTPGSYTITYNASDPSGNAATPVTRTVVVVDTISPVITLNGANPMTVECHTGFTDPGATATDTCAGNLTVTVTGSVNPNVPGTYTLTYSANDGNGHTTTATRTVNVVDTTAPTITLTGQNIELWPPNHKYVTINLTQLVASASDGCDGTVDINDVVIKKVTSDELENSGGDGNTLNDIVIAANCKSVQLRAERDGGGNGRVYTITFLVRDAAGNTTTKTAKVTVPKNQNGTPAVDDGPRYTVNSSCQ